MKILAIVNSLCLQRQKQPKALLERIKNTLGAEIHLTEYKGHASDIAKEAKGFDVILSVGGDGTTFEIINAIGPAGAKLGLIPIGTGNSLAYDLSIDSLDKAFDAIQKGSLTDIDLIEVYFFKAGKREHRYILSVAGVGFFADITKSANPWLKKFGKLCYLMATFFHSFRKTISSCEILLDGKPFDNAGFTNLLINNTSHIGCMKIFKEADITDSKFNVWIGTLGIVKQLIWDLSIITKTQIYWPGSKYALKRMELKFSEPLNMVLDGEIFDSVESVKFLISEQKLSVCRDRSH